MKIRETYFDDDEVGEIVGKPDANVMDAEVVGSGAGVVTNVSLTYA